LHGFHLLFGADFGEERRKGFSELSQALRLCSEDAEFSRRVREKTITVSYFGRASEEIEALGMPIHAHGHIASDEKMAMLYASASLYVLPSLEDNLPNTLLECMSSGTPAAAFDAGGIPDLLKDQMTGWLVPTGDARGLTTAILGASREPERLASMSVLCRATIERTHTLAAQAGSYIRLYEEVKARSLPSMKPFQAMPAFGPEIRRLLPFLVFRSLRERFRGRIRSLPLVGRFV
jgi:glycosyltransferase involved in cell wall biosynthesis